MNFNRDEWAVGVGQVILSFSGYESELTQWLMLEAKIHTGLETKIKRMSYQMKKDWVKALCELRKPDLAGDLDIVNAVDQRVGERNIVAHDPLWVDLIETQSSSREDTELVVKVYLGDVDRKKKIKSPQELEELADFFTEKSLELRNLLYSRHSEIFRELQEL